MRTAALVVLFLAVAAGLAYLTKPRDGRPPRRPRPGEDLPAVDRPPVPTDLVLFRSGVPVPEAHVVMGLLSSAPIKAGMRPAARGGLPSEAPPVAYDIYVDPARVDEARALVEGSGE